LAIHVLRDWRLHMSVSPVKSNLLTCSLALSDALILAGFCYFSSLLCTYSIFSSFLSHIVWERFCSGRCYVNIKARNMMRWSDMDRHSWMIGDVMQ
jgi:hypothetical protein